MAKFNLPLIEKSELENWKEKRILQQILERNRKPAENPRGKFVFYEGPPTANGRPGTHHVLARAFKDAVVRYRTMRGYCIDRKAGWDTHGLPVELEVEKQLGFTKKQQIEEYGVAAFNRKCRESVWKYLDLWQDITRRIGFWVDMDDPYITYKNDYVESLWWILKEISSQEIEGQPMLFEGYRTTPHCPRCVTSLSSHELAQGYKDVEDLSVFVKFAVKGQPGLFFLAWTTTPWTLPANLALAVRSDIEYVEVKLEGSDERFILAKALLGVLLSGHEIVSEKKGSDLVGLEYEPLYDIAPADSRSKVYRVYTADFVSMEDGTGIVHIAPAYGDDDAELGREYGLPPVLSVDAVGIMADGLPGGGKSFKESDDDVRADLVSRGLLYKEEKYLHSYPFCWRCGTPLMYLAKRSWYIRMSKLREELAANNQQINWVPSHIKDGRFGEWLREAKDWALSRERYWGTPLPVWKCTACNKTRVIGGLSELDEVAPARNTYFFQRHGESTSNVARLITSQDLSDKYHLTERGLKQVEEAAAKYAGMGIDFIYASDLHRTKQTAEAIAAACGLKVIYDERLREVKTDSSRDRSEDEFTAQFTDYKERMDKHIEEEDESLRDVRRRIIATLKDIDSRHEGKRIMIVSHGDLLYGAKTGLLGYDDEMTVARMKDEYVNVGEHWEYELPRRPYDEEGHVDVHRPFIDEVKFKCVCGGEMVRELDVLDCWFDSGAMPLAQWGYPYLEGSIERIDGTNPTNFPAEYISEAIDQTRGWFYTMLAISTLLGRGTPYRNVICLGHILDGKGLKMSKSKGNIVDPWTMMDKWGADAIRYSFFTVNQPGEPKRFDEKGLEDVTKKVFLILWNVLSFHQMFAVKGADFSAAPSKPQHVLDQWLLDELDTLITDSTNDLENYQVVDACRRFGGFVNDLSTWYIRRSRDRFKGEESERSEASATLGYTLYTLSRLLAPFTPFLAEALYRELGGQMDSVHLESWPEKSTTSSDEKLVQKMRMVRSAASVGLEKRASAGVPVRQALAKATITANVDSEDWMSELLSDELNVLNIEWKKGEQIEVELDTEITPKLRRLGLLREIVRNVNALRREAGLTPSDEIVLNWESSGDLWSETFAEHSVVLQGSVHAVDLNQGRTETEFSTEIDADGQTLWLGFNH